MPRRKTIEMDGVEFTISPLTLLQVDQLVASRDEVVDAKGDQKEIRKVMFRTVLCTGLNNALPDDAPDTAKWDVERVLAELDLPLSMRLQKEILIFSGLEATEEGPNKVTPIQKPGEATAA